MIFRIGRWVTKVPANAGDNGPDLGAKQPRERRREVATKTVSVHANDGVDRAVEFPSGDHWSAGGEGADICEKGVSNDVDLDLFDQVTGLGGDTHPPVGHIAHLFISNAG